MHYLVCSNIYPTWIINYVERLYIFYDYFSRWFITVGTDPQMYHEFVFGWFMELFLMPNMSSIILTYICISGYYTRSMYYTLFLPVFILFLIALFDFLKLF